MERKEDSHEMAQQSRGSSSSSGGKNPSSIDDRAGHEEPVKLGTTKSIMGRQCSLLQEVMGKETTSLHTEEEPKYFLGMTPKCWEKLMKHNNKEREAAQEAALLADDFNKLCRQSSKSANSAVSVGKSFIAPAAADPSSTATKSIMGPNCSVVQDDHDRSNSPVAPVTKKKQTAAEKEMADEAKSFALHCKVWASKHGKRCGSFFETTVLSSMQFTHYTPGLISFSSFCCTPVTLQILSIKLTRVDGGLEFPLSVYGVIAVRDLVDRNRNILFTRDIIHRQELKQNDPFLHLIGPSRAILFEERVCFEIELRVVAAGSQNKALISCARSYSGGYGDGVYNICFKNSFCTLEVSSQPVKQTVQATILGVQVLHHNESWRPLEYGGLLVACSPLSGEVVITDDGRLGRNIDPSSSPPIVLVDSKHEAVPKGRDGFVHLWRQVVSVELQGRLDFDIKTYSKSGGIAAEGCACFVPQLSNISQKKCLLGDAVVTITVAWSRVATSKMGIATESCAKRCF
uniref:Uncharacterized protein n=1 Tax=Avena sativa TaxID=4498 RepID=A0ACD5Z9H4_AVESA